MVERRTWKHKCAQCKAVVYLREYEGIPDGWYTDHHCEGFQQDSLIELEQTPRWVNRLAYATR